MNNALFIFTIYIVTIIILIVIFALRNSKQNKKLKESISELEKEKNLIINAPILNELSKVEALVKDDKLKYKYDNWQHKFDDIRNIYIPKVTDMLLDADDLVARKKYKELKTLLADIELKIYRLREKTNTLLSEIKITDNDDFLKKMQFACVLGAYIKRRSNIIMLEMKNNLIDVDELALSINESFDYLSLLGVEGSLDFNIQGELSANTIGYIYNFFEKDDENYKKMTTCCKGE